MTLKKRGRPLGKETLEKLRLERMMREIPAFIPRLTAEEQAEIDESIKHGEKIRLEILKTYKHGPWTPDGHAYSMASLGDESFEGYWQRVLDDDSTYSHRAKIIRANAGAENKRKTEIRQLKVMEINKALIEKLRSSRTHNTHRVATMIHQQWASMKPLHRLSGEDKTMTCRGDGGELVSIRTIERWLEKHISTFDTPRKKKNPRP